MTKKKLKDGIHHLFRDHLWRHNSFYGQAKLAERNFRNMMGVPSVTKETEAAISLALKEIERVTELLRTKRDDSKFFGESERNRDVTPPSVEELFEKELKK